MIGIGKVAIKLARRGRGQERGEILFLISWRRDGSAWMVLDLLAPCSFLYFSQSLAVSLIVLRIHLL